MRCPKCGTIGFDYLENCKKCGTGLGDLGKSLGCQVMPSNSLNWFDMARNAKMAKTSIEDEGINNSNGSMSLSEIDISDLVGDGRQSGDDVLEMDQDTIKKIAANEEFQHALNKLVKEG